MRYLGIDYGHKRCGLALSDAGGQIACPFGVYKAGSGFLEQVIKVIKNEQIDSVVIGLPLNMDGTEGPGAKRARKFGDQLGRQIDICIDYFDERLSSFAAEQKLQGAELTRKGKKKRLDAVAAAEILQNYIDNKKP